MSRKMIITFFVLSVILTGCTHDKIDSLFDLSQEQKAKTWQVAGNTYSTTVSYDTPAGVENNIISLTMEGELITNVQIAITTEDKTSIRYQTSFSEDVKPLVIGKKITDLGPLDKVSGATYTTEAFNNAIAALKQEL